SPIDCHALSARPARCGTRGRCAPVGARPRSVPQRRGERDGVAVGVALPLGPGVAVPLGVGVGVRDEVAVGVGLGVLVTTGNTARKARQKPALSRASPTTTVPSPEMPQAMLSVPLVTPKSLMPPVGVQRNACTNRFPPAVSE